MFNQSSQLESRWYSRFVAPHFLARESDTSGYQMDLENLRVEQITESTIVIDWQVQAKLNDLQDQVTTLQNQVMVMTQDYQKLREFLYEIDPGVVGVATPSMNIEWDHVRSVVEAATLEFSWDVRISIDASENLIVIKVKEEQDDLIAETTFDFNSSIISQLGQDVFKALRFFYISDSDH